jgi:hypothetical protein
MQTNVERPYLFGIKLSIEERDAIRDKAKQADRKPSDWARRILVKASKT